MSYFKTFERMLAGHLQNPHQQFIAYCRDHWKRQYVQAVQDFENALDYHISLNTLKATLLERFQNALLQQSITVPIYFNNRTLVGNMTFHFDAEQLASVEYQIGNERYRKTSEFSKCVEMRTTELQSKHPTVDVFETELNACDTQPYVSIFKERTQQKLLKIAKSTIKSL